MSKKGENIYKRKDGRWEARYIKGHKTDGGIRYGYCYGKTYYEAKEKANYARAAVLNHQTPPGKGCKKKFSLCCDEWLLLKRSQVKESTYVKYGATLEKHIKPGLGKYPAEAVSEMVIEQFSYELLNEEHLSAKTVHDILSVVHSILVYAARQIPSMGAISMTYPREARKEMRVLSNEEQCCFVRYLLKDMDACRFGVLLALLTGLRIGEICALRWEDISLHNRTVCVRRTMQRLKNLKETGEQKTRIVLGAPKSAQSVKIIPLNDYTADLCKRWQVKNSAAYVLTGEENQYMEPRTLQYRMARYTKECGLEGVHFHTLRHSFATRCIEVGFEIKSLSEILAIPVPGSHWNVTCTLPWN
ncbi:MAG: tyrosine-type recombinase/integrase [Ruminococcus sp.]